MKEIPVTLIIGAALNAYGKSAGEIAAVADGNKDIAGGSETGRDSDSLTSMGAESGDETNGNVIVHRNTSFQGILYHIMLESNRGVSAWQ